MAENILNAPSNDIGLTPVHLAVLQNDLNKLTTLIESREYGVDALDSRKATPLMLAAVSGRADAFMYLMKKGGSRKREDRDGFKVVQYLLPQNTERMASIYEPYTRKGFCQQDREVIVGFWKAYGKVTRQGGPHLKEKEKVPVTGTAPVTTPTSDTKPVTTPATAPAIAPIAAPVSAPDAATIAAVPSNAPTTIDGETRDIIIHHENEVIFGKIIVQASAKFDKDMSQKTMAAIRGRAEGSPFQILAISGWTGEKVEEGMTVIDNHKYTRLTKAVSEMFGLVLNGNPVDYMVTFPGTFEERRGIFYCCHAERQLATWLIEECVFRVVGTRTITLENIAQVKEKLDTLPMELRETEIELGHYPCMYCIDYMRLLRKKAALKIRLTSRDWLVKGERTNLRCGVDRFIQEEGISDYRKFINDEFGTDDQEDEEPIVGPMKARTKKIRPFVDTRRYRRGPSVHADPSDSAEPGPSSQAEAVVEESSDREQDSTSSPLGVSDVAQPSSRSIDEIDVLSSMQGFTSSPPAKLLDSAIPQREPSSPQLGNDVKKEMNNLPYLHKRRRSTVSIIDVSSGSSTPDVSNAEEDEVDNETYLPRLSSPLAPDFEPEEREAKRKKHLHSFKNVVIEFAHVASDEPAKEDPVSPQHECEKIPKDFLANMKIIDPFPGASSFTLNKKK